MSSAIKAVLLSAFVMPGAGHWHLKSYTKAAVITATIFVCIGLIVREAVIRTQVVIEKIQADGSTFDFSRIFELTKQAIQQGDTQLVAIATYTIIGCWLLGLLDAYRLGRQADKK